MGDLTYNARGFKVEVEIIPQQIEYLEIIKNPMYDIYIAAKEYDKLDEDEKEL